MTDAPETTDPTVKVARDLREIVTLAGWLEDQAEHKADNKANPGGAALLELAPAAPLADVLERIEATEHWNATHYGEPGQRDLSHVNDMDLEFTPGEKHHVVVSSLTDLLFWSEDWRNQTGSEMPAHPSIATEADWLRSALPWAYDNEVQWNDFAKAMQDVRGHLEAILYAGNRAERTRVPCLDCAARLIKVYSDKAKYDHWRCPNKKCDRGRYDLDEFIRAKAQHLHSEGADRFVPVSDAVAAVGRTEHTVRTWMRRGLIKTERDETTGQLRIWWPDVREQSEQAKRRAAAKKRIA